MYIHTIEMHWKSERKRLSVVINQCITCRIRLLYGFIGLMSRVFANGPKDGGSIPGQVIPKTQKMVLDVTLLSTRHYKMRIKGKEEQSWEWSCARPLHLGVVAIEKGAFESPSTKVVNFTFYFILSSSFFFDDWGVNCTIFKSKIIKSTQNNLRKIPNP